MNAIINFLKGKKTYLVGILMIVLGVINNDQKMIMDGLGFLTIRAAIGKIGQ